MALQSRQYENELLCFFKAAHLRISAPKDMDWTLDGEFQPGAENIDIQNLHNAVRLILPRDSFSARRAARDVAEIPAGRLWRFRRFPCALR